MRFFSLFRHPPGPPANPNIYQDMQKFMDECVRAGVLLHTEGFGASGAQDARVRLENGKYTVTDGPFAETKEVIGGFAIMQTRTRDEILEWTRRFLAICGPGECEIHQISDASPMDQFKK